MGRSPYRNSLKKVALLAGAFLFFSAAGWSQTTTLEGDVKGEDGKGLKDAIVKIERVDIKGNYKTKTDKKGHWIHAGLPIGTYNIILEIEGKERDRMNNVRSRLGDPTPINFNLAEVKQRAEAMQKALTQDHPRGRTLTAELVDELNLEKSLALYKDRFADASDFTFVFVGTFDLATVRPLVERYLGGLPSTRRQETWRDVGMRPPAGVVQRSIHKGIEPKSQVGIVFTGPFEYDAQHRVVIRALANILQTRLRELVREELGGTYGISASARYTKVPEQRYEFQIQWGCNPERVDELVKAVFGDITAIRASGPTGKQLGDVREQLLRDFETNSRQNSYLATQLYFRYLYNEDVRTLFEMPEAYKKLTPAVIQEAARTYLNPENYVQLTLLPEPRTTPEPGK